MVDTLYIILLALLFIKCIYGKENMQISEIVANPQSKPCRASQVHKVPRKTLRNWMKRWHIKSAYPMPVQLRQAAEKSKRRKQSSSTVSTTFHHQEQQLPSVEQQTLKAEGTLLNETKKRRRPLRNRSTIKMTADALVECVLRDEDRREAIRVWQNETIDEQQQHQQHQRCLENAELLIKQESVDEWTD